MSRSYCGNSNHLDRISREKIVIMRMKNKITARACADEANTDIMIHAAMTQTYRIRAGASNCDDDAILWIYKG